MLWRHYCSPCAKGAARSPAQKLRVARPFVQHNAWPLLSRYHSSQQVDGNETRRSSLSVPAKARFNEIGVQQLSDHVYSQIFFNGSQPPDSELVALSKDHLARHELLGKAQENADPVGFDLPALQGQTLDEHFFKLGMDSSEPYLTYAKEYATVNSPSIPRKWVRRSGWTKYNSDGTSEAVDAPNELMLTFDTEVMYKEHPFAVMACAVSPTSWYAWISPWLLGETKNEIQLVPLGDPTQSRIIVGHNIGYDRARVFEEYDLKQTGNFFLDTMSLHVAVNGMCSQQRPTWMRHKKNKDLRDKIANDNNSVELAAMIENKMLREEEEELWVGRSSVNSLRDVAKFHCDVTIDKSQRDYFGELDRPQILGKLDELLDYCAADVSITHRVYKKVFPNFLEVCPHPVSFGALRHLSSVILPVNHTWKKYLESAESTYHQRLDDVQRRLVKLCDEALAVKDDPENYSNDPWLRQLDWSGQEIKMVKGKKKSDPPRPAARQKKPGMPQWYKDLFSSNIAEINLTVRTRISPILLKLSWDGHPLIWSDKHGWTFKVPRDKAHQYANQPVVACDMSEEKNLELQNDVKHIYYKLPHKDGPLARCVSPLAKGYLQYFERGTLSSQYALAKEALEMNASCSYWISARDRIMGQVVVYGDDTTTSEKDKTQDLGFILPQIIPMGTITRRAVENTWLTASNAKGNRVGSELKAMIKAPPGYAFVGADVDSQELWIASLIGDAQFQLHGGNAIGFMTLEGSKAAGTDMHSRTAKILGISRNDAKVFNYGRIYGAGVKFAATLLRQFNPSMTERQTQEVATNLYKATKGAKTTRRLLSESSFWRGGTESFVFNKLEEFADQERPRTPVLGAGITEALMRRFINKGSFMTSRINWAIQSSGVDYLHLLIIAMDYLIRRFNIQARLAITVHDEIRYLVKEEDKYRAALALQVANVWTRAMFSQQVGINDLPQSCAYFSQVDIDHVLRKEVDMDCVTPSHPHKIPHGESLDIVQLLDKDDKARLDPSIVPISPPSPEKYTYTPRSTVMSALETSNNPALIKAQITKDDKELREIIKDLTKSNTPTKPPNTRSTTRTKSMPAAAVPQKAILIDIGSGLYGGGFRGFSHGSRPPQVNLPRHSWKPRPTARA
ncbi:DNA polymerase family A-domain-containing protein [Aspergillus pseudoustus]|uniref:DNA-directed DNA polymerase n=1 Tax=Aspergillus pseudoustus TaxID=1810923 RepID=A0ABR4KGV1_9EURO